MSSEQELFNTQARLSAIQEINTASERSLDLAQQMASFAQEEAMFKQGILSDSRSSADIAKKIKEQTLAAKAAEAEKMRLFRAGKVDAAAQLGIIAKQTKKRVEDLKILGEHVALEEEKKKSLEKQNANLKKFNAGMNTVVASAMGTAS